jgi:hypothetical protein
MSNLAIGALTVKSHPNHGNTTMLTLSLPTGPYWLALPHGVRLRIRPVTTAVLAAAQARAQRDVEALRSEPPPDYADLSDPDVARGVAFATLVKALARHAIVAWEGVGDANGAPLGFAPDHAAALMDIEEMATAFWSAAMAPLDKVTAEGNASRPAPHGSSVTGRTTVAAARPSGVPAASPVPPAPTPPKASKVRRSGRRRSPA